ncbi:MAG TPA: hypothetical protein VFL70_08450 [Bacteroidia bacterium]|nr:hypothetical protein [Bacteroidia bacterium]
MPNEYKIFKHEVIEFYKRNPKFDFFKIDASELKISDKMDKKLYMIWRSQIKDELIKEGVLVSKDPYRPNVLDYVKPKKEPNEWKDFFLKEMLKSTIGKVLAAVFTIIVCAITYKSCSLSKILSGYTKQYEQNAK